MEHAIADGFDDVADLAGNLCQLALRLGAVLLDRSRKPVVFHLVFKAMMWGGLPSVLSRRFCR
ncbi:hypothetical protein [Leisingera caerulea]|uniref:hypothetical protein n=1 Tax=Leisingera caerulea TaxID=506591 RepID=UPI0021A413C0|nr:hypothetical protein [Leisingera caerulea]UWQ83691.1 hypothetical protein K3726_00365 [Leisingera caerulea]